MVQTRMEEKVEAHNQEMIAMRKEVSKIPAIEEKLTTISVQTEKTHQMLIMLMESITKERTITSEKMAESSVLETNSMKAKEKEGSTSKDYKGETKGGKNEGEDETSERNKFKKVEMPVFNGEDPDSWLFRAERYFQIHKLTDAEVLVAMVSLEGPALNWYRAQEEHDKFTSWINLKDRLLVRF